MVQKSEVGRVYELSSRIPIGIAADLRRMVQAAGREWGVKTVVAPSPDGGGRWFFGWRASAPQDIHGLIDVTIDKAIHQSLRTLVQ